MEEVEEELYFVIYMHDFFFFFHVFFKAGSNPVAQACLELSMLPKIALNSQSFCLCLPNAGITGMNHHTLYNRNLYNMNLYYMAF
jgi:hypothetical protein